MHHKILDKLQLEPPTSADEHKFPVRASYPPGHPLELGWLERIANPRPLAEYIYFGPISKLRHRDSVAQAAGADALGGNHIIGRECFAQDCGRRGSRLRFR
jgi:hypothetical protein